MRTALEDIICAPQRIGKYLSTTTENDGLILSNNCSLTRLRTMK